MAADELVEKLRGLHLNAPGDVWVDTVWELDFTDTEPLDSRIVEDITENGVEVFSKLYEKLLPFASEDQGTTESVWSVLKENNLSQNALVAILHHFVVLVRKKKATLMQREYALHAAGLYFLLLEIPGSVANKAFHPVLFEKCLDALRKSWPAEMDLSRKRKKDVGKSSQSDPKGRKRNKPVRREKPDMEDMFDEEDEEGGDQEDVYFTTHDILRIRNTIFVMLKNFLRLLSKFPMKEKPQCVVHCLQIFIELTRIEPAIGQMHFTESSNVSRMRSIPELAYHGLKMLCLPMHGEGDQTVRRVFHRILNVILMMGGEEGSTPTALAISQQVVNAKHHAVRFVSCIVEEMKDRALPILRILLQHICTKVVDKQEYRMHASQALVKLLQKLPSPEYASFIDWLYKYSQNTKIAYRAFALDVVIALLELPEREIDESVPQEHQKYLQHKFLIQVMIFGRCSDRAPTVRSRALTCLSQCLENKGNGALGSVQEMLQGNLTQLSSVVNSTENTNINPEAISNVHRKTGTLKTIEISSAEATSSDGKEVISMLRLRTGDEKTNVRKSALQVFMSILKFGVIPCTSEDLSTLQDRCRDPAVSVRKQALQSLTELLVAQPGNVMVQKAWLTGVVPEVIDTESSVQEKSLECLDQVILQHIKHFSKYRNDDSIQKLAWDLLALLTAECQELSRYLTKAFYIWAKQDKFSATFINNLISHTESEHSPAAWMILAKVAGCSPKLNYGKILETWEDICRHKNSDANNVTTGHVLSVIGHIAKHVPETTRDKLTEDIKTWLKNFHSSPEVISPAAEALYKLCQAQSDSIETCQVILDEVCGDVVSACEIRISDIVLKENGADQLDEEMLVRYLFTLGEVAQLCPSKVEKRVFLLVHSILASSINVNPAYNPVDGEDPPVTQPLSQFSGSAMPSVVRAHAFITLGKLCLQHDALAKKCIAALARELEVCEDVAIRNNVIIVMCDLCIRYTTMVDRYIPNIAVCLKDPEPFIRKQTLIMLTNLLQEEFIKWKGSLFFRFVSILVDPDPSIASFGEFCLVHLLLKRNPVMFSQHFIECIFHFNGYEKHEQYNKFSQTEREKRLFSLKGNANKEKRSKIYKFLLDHFTDEQRFDITTKISQNVLVCFVDGILSLDMEASDLLSDTFDVLSSKEIKLSAMRTKPGEEVAVEDDEMAMANVVIEAAQKKLISHVQKKNFIENVIPIITSLKGMLEQKKLPALQDLMNYLREMMQDYRNEIKDIFAADKQLAAEIEYDMRKYEEQLEREKEQENQITELNTDVANVPGTPQQSPRRSLASSPSVRTRSVPKSPAAARHPPVAVTPQNKRLVPSILFTSPKQGTLKTAGGKERRLSLSTIAILNSAKKAVECTQSQRSKSTGALIRSPSKGCTTPVKQVSFQSTQGQSSDRTDTGGGRAISTPDNTINNVTFGAGVSYISMNQTPSSLKGKEASQAEAKNVLYLMSPDKPTPRPAQWNVESPISRKCDPHQRRRTRSKTPLKPSN
ncbi:condensin-2 complex subunit D3 [Protopterus annectens]|uniref:condensin-2 complex subunit D3 n=1 Tax=Protopterus annectens TaxID=7888 RepID=UPI001CFB6030|nr:condensin-2 complex subunit D3 [Protopterus annectens]